MTINCPGFTGLTLHMYSEYFEDKPLERLITPGIEPEHINDDALVRCLNALYEKGVSYLYYALGEAVVKHLDLPYDSVHLDSTSFIACRIAKGKQRGRKVFTLKPLILWQSKSLRQAVPQM